MENYDVGQLIGEGGFALVFRAVHRQSSREVAIKRININHMSALMNAKTPDFHLHRLNNELHVQLKYKHPSLVEGYEVFRDEGSICIALEYCRGGSLYQYLRRCSHLSEQDAINVTKQLLEAVTFLHDRWVIHRDLKLSNILLVHNLDNTDDKPISNKLQIKLADFGLAAQLHHPDEEHFTLCGTPRYIAPEIAAKDAHGFSADIWSIGLLFYTMIVGLDTAPHIQQLQEQVMRQLQDPDCPAQDIRSSCEAIIVAITRHIDELVAKRILSDTARDFLGSILLADPRFRPSARDLLNHVLFQEGIEHVVSMTPGAAVATEPASAWTDQTRKLWSTTSKPHDSTPSAVLPNKDDSKKHKEIKDGFCKTPKQDLSFNDLQPSLSRQQEQQLQLHNHHADISKLSNSRSHSQNLFMQQSRESFQDWSSALQEMQSSVSDNKSQHQHQQHGMQHQNNNDVVNVIGHMITSLEGLSPFLLHTKRGEIAALTKEGHLLYCKLTSSQHHYKAIRLILDIQQVECVSLGSLSLAMMQDVIRAVGENCGSQDDAIRQSLCSLSSLEDGSAATHFRIDETLSSSILSAADPATCSKHINLANREHTDNKTEAVLRLLTRLAKLVDGIRCRVPRLIMYCNSSSSSSGSAVTSASSSNNQARPKQKCMLMSSYPLPDFHSQWEDGSRMRYSLQSGRLFLYKPAGVPTMQDVALRWQGELAFSQHQHGHHIDALQLMGMPSLLQKYLAEGQGALMKCLREDRRHGRGHQFGSEDHRSQDSITTTSKYPIVIVEDSIRL